VKIRPAGLLDLARIEEMHRSADIRLFDSNGVILDKKAERKLENVFFREDIRRVHFYEMGDITYAQDAVDSYIDGLIALIDVETVRRADRDHRYGEHRFLHTGHCFLLHNVMTWFGHARSSQSCMRATDRS